MCWLSTTVAVSSILIWCLNDNFATKYLDGKTLCLEHATCYKGRPLRSLMSCIPRGLMQRKWEQTRSTPCNKSREIFEKGKIQTRINESPLFLQIGGPNRHLGEALRHVPHPHLPVQDLRPWTLQQGSDARCLNLTDLHAHFETDSLNQIQTDI